MIQCLLLYIPYKPNKNTKQSENREILLLSFNGLYNKDRERTEGMYNKNVKHCRQDSFSIRLITFFVISFYFSSMFFLLSPRCCSAFHQHNRCTMGFKIMKNLLGE